LIEMLVLIIIMVVLSTVVVPAYSRLREQAAFDAYMGDLTGFLAQMRAIAVEQGCDVELTFDLQSDTFTARAETGDQSGDMPTAMTGTSEASPVLVERSFVLPDEFAVRDFQVFGPDLYATATVAGRETVVMFHEDGTSDGMRFTVDRDTGQTATITLWPTTGLAEVESGDVSGATWDGA
jgi:Tfp pilus assembly protein FimT